MQERLLKSGAASPPLSPGLPSGDSHIVASDDFTPENTSCAFQKT